MSWHHGAVIYQVYARSFQDGDGDGIGDLAGITARLPYIAALGVDAVWITPFFASPMEDFGYDVADFRAVDPLFGTMAEFDRLLDTAHGLGLKVILDMVWAHTSDRHPWFTDHPDWYVWTDAPNNWLSVFGGPAWSFHEGRGRWYLHHFLPSQPALDWRNPQVVEALLAVGRFWLDKGVDGFRLDAIDFLLHDRALRDNPPNPQPGAKPFSGQLHLYDILQPQVPELLARIRALTDDYPGTITIGEQSSSGDTITRAGTYTAPGKLYAAYTLGLIRRPLAALPDAIADVEAKADGGFCWAFSNHDVERANSRWGDGSEASARLLNAVLVSLRGCVCLYQGEELGLTEADIPFDRLQDPYGKAFWPEYKGRDGSRTPMPWTRDGGFSTAEPWLPIPPEHLARAVAVQEADPASPLNTLRRLLKWRQTHPALRVGGIRLVEMPGVLAFERFTDAETVLCLFNLSAMPVRTPVNAVPMEGFGWRMEGTLMLDGWGAAFIQ